MAESVREELLASDEKFRQLAQEHAAYEQRLEGLLTKSHISEQEQLEETKLKKLKLRLKDEMEELERHRRSIAVA